MELKDFKQRIKETEAKCQICGQTNHSLIRHLRETHSLSPAQYKDQHPTAPLTSKVVTEILRRMDRRAKATNDLESVGLELLPELGSTWLERTKEYATKQFTAPDPSLEQLVPKIDPFYHMPAEGKLLAYAILRGKNAYLEGPTGCGKTELMAQLMAHLKRPFQRVNMHGDVTAAKFIGQMRVNTQGTYFEKGDLPKAMEGVQVLCVQFPFV